METDDTYVPVSARVDFKLQAWKDAEELPEFTLLQTETSTLVKDIQAQLKTKIIQNIRLERTVLSASIAKHYCESIAAALSLFLVADGQDSTHASSIAITILQSNSASLLKHVAMSSNDFIALYRTINHVPGGTNTTEEFGTLRGAVKRHIESTFVTAWDTYLQRQRDNELSLALKKKAKEVIQTQATEEAAMEIDAELPASRQQLQDLIQREAKKLARSMIQKEVTMQVKHALKNTPGGQSKKAASPKKTRQKKGNGSNARSTRGATDTGSAEAGTNSGTDTRSDDGNDSTTSSRYSANRNQRNGQQNRRNNRQPQQPQQRNQQQRQQNRGGNHGAGASNSASRREHSGRGAPRLRSRSRNRSGDGRRQSDRSSRS
jgi:hypothetical protein